MNDVIYCEFAKAIYDIDVVCSKDCPLSFKKCPILILEDGQDKVNQKAIKAFINMKKKEVKR